MSLITIKGDTVEQKFTHIERILQRFSRRLHKTVVGLIPASPIFGYCESSAKDPIILRAIFPADGVITQAAMRAGKCGKNARVRVDVRSGDEEFSKSFPLKTKATVQEANFPVEAGDSLEVWVVDISDDDEGSSGVLVGFLYQVGMKDLTNVKFLIDQFEALIEENQDAGES